jgi:hypothetical protein
MLDKLSIAKKSVEEVLINLMIERVMLMSTNVQESSTRGLPSSSLTTRGVRPSRSSNEKRTKNKDDIEKYKLI